MIFPTKPPSKTMTWSVMENWCKPTESAAASKRKKHLVSGRGEPLALREKCSSIATDTANAQGRACDGVIQMLKEPYRGLRTQ
jgi:hypothetical protein